jgi:hypothetical protein
VTHEPELSFQIPDAIEPIVAYRVWSVELPGGDAVLHSMNGTPWERAAWSRAECGRPNVEPFVRISSHESPAEGCSCGIYAVKELPYVAPVTWALRTGSAVYLLGTVELAGKVIEHDRGYRAERARVLEILPAPGQESLAEHVAAAYGARVSDDLIEAFPRLQARGRRTPPSAPRRRRWVRGRREWTTIAWTPFIALMLSGLARAEGPYLSEHPALWITVLATAVIAGVAWIAFDRERH